MSPAATIAVVLGSTLGSLLLSWVLIRALVTAAWSSLPRRFPRQEQLPGAVVKRMQSCNLHGWCNFGGCMTIAVDERRLHLIPWPLVQWWGAAPTSIPWEEITDVRPTRRKAWCKARLGGTAFQGPAWCLELAFPVPSEPDAQARVLRERPH